jgi:hypothetical protein
MEDPVSPRRTQKTVWDDAEIVVSIGYTKPGTALGDHLRKEQTRGLRAIDNSGFRQLSS